MIDWEKARPLIKKGLTDKAVAQVVGCHQSSIKLERLKMGISRSRKIDYEAVDVLIYINKKDKDVAKLVGCTEQTIALRRRKLGIKKKYREYASRGTPVRYYPDVINYIYRLLQKEFEIKGDINGWINAHKLEVVEFLSSIEQHT